MGLTVAAGKKLGQYEIVKHLATGGMAELLIARTRGLVGFERHVVIKRIRDDHQDRLFIDLFLNEASLAALLHHHNIVQLLDIGEEDGRPYFAMEYVHGEDLRKLLHAVFIRRELVPIEHVVSIVTTIAVALHHAHEQRGPDRKPLGIVHRDVTPGNIIVGYDGNVKVVDFGIAKAAMTKVVTQAGTRKGKAPYMSPEQCRGAVVDRRSDIFALGIVLHETVTGRRLFKGANEHNTMRAVVHSQIPRPGAIRKDVPPELDAIILRALARDPADRYQTAEEMVHALEAFAAAAGLRSSANALADYMKRLFGTRLEPWVAEATPAPVIDVDFDDTLVVDPIEESTITTPGAAPAESDVTNTDVMPLQEVSVQPAKKPPLPMPSRIAAVDKPKLPSVLARPAKPEPPAPVVLSAPVVRATTESEDPGELPPPPPPPRPSVPLADTTAIVKPLPPPVPESREDASNLDTVLYDDSPVPAKPRRSKLPWIGTAGLAAVAIAVLAFGAGGSDDRHDDAVEPAVVTPAARVVAPEPPAEEAPRTPRTWASTQEAMESAEPVQIAEPVPVPEPVKVVEPVPVPVKVAEPEPVPEPVKVPEPEPEPVKVAEPEPVPPRPAAKPVAVATRPRAAKPAPIKRAAKSRAVKPTPTAKWNPDSLFPNKK